VIESGIPSALCKRPGSMPLKINDLSCFKPSTLLNVKEQMAGLINKPYIIELLREVLQGVVAGAVKTVIKSS
jgi:hypothetical protein